MDILMEENPYGNPWYGQPRRHKWAAEKGWRQRRRRSHRNPIGNPVRGLTTQVQNLTQGIGAPEIIAAAGGLAAALTLPKMFNMQSATGTQKFMRLLVAALGAVGVGFAARQFLSQKAGQAAIAGGLAGVALVALNQFAGQKFGIADGGGRLISSLGDANLINPRSSRTEETTGFIQP